MTTPDDGSQSEARKRVHCRIVVDTTSLLQSIAVVNLSALDPDGGEGGEEAAAPGPALSSGI